MGMKRSWRAARRVALRRSGDSSHHPADTIACTATAEAGARVLPAAPAAPPPGLAPRSPHSPSLLPAKVSDLMGPPGLHRFFMARLDFYALLSQALCPLLDPVTAARHLFSAVLQCLFPALSGCPQLRLFLRHTFIPAPSFLDSCCLSLPPVTPAHRS